LSAIVLLPEAFWYFGRSLLSAILMYANFFFYNTGGYFSAPSLEKPLLHTWSLAVEDQFYVTWPLILMAFYARMSRPALIAATIAIGAVSLGYAQYKLGTDPEFAFFMLPARAWELLTGAVLALATPQLRLSRPIAEALSALGLALIVASFWWLSSTSNFPGLGAVPACVGTAAMIAAGVSGRTFATRFLSLQPLVFTGLMSYSLYLWHWPLLALASYWRERPLVPIEAAAIVAISVIVALISWRFVERPFRTRHGADMPPGVNRDRRFVVTSLAAVVLIAGMAGAIKINKGYPERFGLLERPLLEQLVAGNPLRGSCDDFQNIFEHDDICNFGRKKTAAESYDVALFGDSMADHWTPLVASYAEEKNLAGRQVTNGGCALLFGTAIPASPAAKARECAAYQAAAEKFIDANPKLKIAVISGFWEKWLSRLEVPAADDDTAAAKQILLQPGDAADTFDRALAETVDVFTKRGIKVLLIGQIPTYAALPVRCIVSAARKQTDAVMCGKPRDQALAELRMSNAALKRLAALNRNVTVSLPIDFMCQAQRCSPLLNGTLLYKNGGHINRFGALILRQYVAFPEGH
jgi:peptidoglycan/LPS O-acetylase OafA/YrhL